MARVYPQETVGTTLLLVDDGGERRRVYMRKRRAYLEVGEFTRGVLTQEIYQNPVHLHSIHLPLGFSELDLGEFFEKGEPFLADCMDALDARHVRYGYLNTEGGKLVCYRPAGFKV